jgi:hypothetical protein
MFGRDGSGLRGRNVEDLGELEEKGLLRRKSPDRGQSQERMGMEGMGSPRRRAAGSGKGVGSGEKGKEVVFERIKLDEKEEHEGGGGLTSTRDKQAFALLVLLCKSTGSVISH